MARSALFWTLAVLSAILGYELLRYIVVGAVRARIRRSAWRFIERNRVRIDPFKFGGRILIRHELANDIEIQQAMLQAARERGVEFGAVRTLVEEWIDEMAPRFSLATYYKFGYAVARLALRVAYAPLVDAESLKRAEAKLPDDAVRIYVINHRSNADYILVSYALAQRIALSWAVGEWARVFPLETLFKAFGAFFIRRKFKDPLYHTVLRRYVQLITKRGVTQGFFPEGMLTRTGAFNEPRVGLLDYIVSVKRDPEFRRDIRFIPVGIQFDRVLEDEVLIAEKQGRERPPTALEKLRSLASLLWRIPRGAFRNAVRVVLRRPFRQGYAAVSFGEPLSLDRWLAERPGTLDLPKEERQARVRSLAQELMARIGAVVPATPVPLVCRAALDAAAGSLETPLAVGDLATRVAALRRRLAAARVPLVTGGRVGIESETDRLAEETESGERRPELAAVESEIAEAHDAEATVREGLDVLRRRRLVVLEDRLARFDPRARPVFEYYARSVPALAVAAAAASPSPALAPAAAPKEAS